MRIDGIINLITAFLSRTELTTAAMDVDDASKSVNSLIKYSDGNWKSEKQAAFLMRSLKSFTTDGSKAWAARLTKDPNAFGIELVKIIDKFGKYDMSKIRFSGAYYLIDSYGVARKDKVKVDHSRNEEGKFTYETVPSGTTEVWTRKSTGDISYDLSGKLRDERKEAEKKIKENQPLIKEIESIPGYDDNDRMLILHQFVWQLKKGKDLSPKQMAIVNKYRSATDVLKDLPDIDDLLKMMDEMDSVIKTVILPEMAKAGFHQDSISGLKKYLSTGKPQEGVEENTVNRVFNEVAKVDFFRLVRGTGALSGYFGIRPHLRRAKMAIDKGKAPTKKSLGWLTIIPVIHKKITKINRSQVAKLFNE